MPRRRPRCACGDLYNHHAFVEGGIECRGNVCIALSYRDMGDDCSDYIPVEEYEPLEPTLARLGVDRPTYQALLSESAEWTRTGKLGPLGQAARAAAAEKQHLDEEAAERQWLVDHPWEAARPDNRSTSSSTAQPPSYADRDTAADARQA